MRTMCYLPLLILLLNLVTGCASEHQVRDIDDDAFARHFAAQDSCKAYIDSMVMLAAEKLSTKRTPEAMRAWFIEHPEDAFSEVVVRVQNETMTHGALDPRRESDQIKVTARLFEVLRARSGFEEASCGPDVREYVMESFYLGLGGEDSQVADELRQRGIDDSWEQRWVLLTILMAGVLTSK